MVVVVAVRRGVWRYEVGGRGGGGGGCSMVSYW